MKDKEVITISDAINACNLLLVCSRTRIPEESIKELIDELSNEVVMV